MSRDNANDGGSPDYAEQLKAANAQLRERNAQLGDARKQLAERLAEIEAIYEYAPVGMALFDRERRYVRINPRLAEINGMAADAHIGQTLSQIAPGMADHADAAIDKVFATGEPIRHDRVMGFLNNHSETSRVFDIEWYPVFRDGAVDRVSVLVDDATDAERHDMFARHMVRELQHRVKNSLANVMALVEQASRSERPKEEVLSVLKERISALAAIHGKLTERNWESVEFSVLVQQEIAREKRPSRIAFGGPDIALGPQSSLALSMALHELAANARRHGALSCPTGKLQIHWTIEGKAPSGQMILRWHESGCEMIEERGAPGFGTRLIATSVRNALRGELTEQWLDDGLFIEMKLPLVSIAPPEQEFAAGIGRRINPAF